MQANTLLYGFSIMKDKRDDNYGKASSSNKSRGVWFSFTEGRKE